jgi:hypothetical protein
LYQRNAGCTSLGEMLHRFGFAPVGWPNATPATVSAAYRKAAMQLHPDRISASTSKHHATLREEAFKLLTRVKEERGLT